MKRTSSVKLRRKEAGTWLKGLRGQAGLTQTELAGRLGFKYYPFVSQVETGFSRVPTDAVSTDATLPFRSIPTWFPFGSSPTLK